MSKTKVESKQVHALHKKNCSKNYPHEKVGPESPSDLKWAGGTLNF